MTGTKKACKVQARFHKGIQWSDISGEDGISVIKAEK